MNSRISMEEFKGEVKLMIYYVRSYGYDKYIETIDRDTDHFVPEDMVKFSNHAFKEAQKMSINGIQLEQEEQSRIKSLLKKARRERNNTEKSKLNWLLKISEWRELVYRCTIDSIVWQLLGRKREIIARLCMEEPKQPTISGEGFDVMVNYVNEINKDESKVAILLDLTTSIQIHDVLIFDSGRITFAEIKSGVVNKEILESLGKVSKIEDPPPIFDKLKQPKKWKQAQRILSQKIKAEKVHKIVSEDKGEHPLHENYTVHLNDRTEPLETYQSTIIELIESLSKDNKWAYTKIDNIIHVGVYKDEWRSKGKEIISKLNSGQYVYDLRESLGMGICEPLFCKEFSDDIILDIVFADIVIVIGVDLNNIIEYAKLLGCNARWSTKREFNKMRTHYPNGRNEIIHHDNRAVIFSCQDGKDKFLGSGFLFKLAFDNYSPLPEIRMRIC